MNKAPNKARNTKDSMRSDLKKLIDFSARFFSPYFRKHRNSNTDKVELYLRKARTGISYDQYLSLALLLQIIIVFVSLVSGTVASLVDRRYLLIIVSAVFLSNVVALAVLLEIPAILVTRLRKSIDSMITVSIGFFATMASSGVTIDQMMRMMGENRLYGAVSTEARLIYVKTSMFGMDIISSIKESARTCASVKFSDLLQGIVTSVSSGGNVKDYLVFRAKELQDDTRVDLRKNSETMGILSESFITVGVAFPLILLIIIAVIADLFPYNGRLLIFFLFAISLLVIPVILIIFGYFIQSTAGEIEL